MGAGERLQEERLKQGFSLERIEDETKIRKYYLQALEEENYQLLPPKVYATGFVKRYAKFLNLDETELVEEFKRQAYADEQPEAITQVMQEITPVNKVMIPWRNIMAGVIFLLLAVWVGNYVVGYLSERGAQNGPITPPGIQQPDEPEPEPKPEPVQPPPSTAPVARLELKTNQPCWLLVIVDGETQYTGTLPAGEERVFQGNESIYIKAGSAGALELTFNGEKQEPLGAVGEVKDREFPAE